MIYDCTGHSSVTRVYIPGVCGVYMLGVYGRTGVLMSGVFVTHTAFFVWDCVLRTVGV